MKDRNQSVVSFRTCVYTPCLRLQGKKYWFCDQCFYELPAYVRNKLTASATTADGIMSARPSVEFRAWARVAVGCLEYRGRTGFAPKQEIVDRSYAEVLKQIQREIVQNIGAGDIVAFSVKKAVRLFWRQVCRVFGGRLSRRHREIKDLIP